MTRAQAGDTEAFEHLVRSYHRRAVSLAYRLVGNLEDAGDVSQDAFIRAYKNIAQLEDPARFGAWFLRVVGNLSLNFRRARRSRPASSLDEMGGDGADMLGPKGGRSEAGDGKALPAELSDAISDAMDRLPDKQRLALVLFSVEGMPQKQVAEILGCTIEMVKWNVFQARRKMKDMLSEHL